MNLCKKLKLELKPNGQMAKLGDGCTMMASLGEVDVHLTRNKWSLRLQAIVVEKLNSEVYGGMNFLKENDIQTRPLTGEIKVLNKFTVYQTNTLMSPPQLKSVKNCSFDTYTVGLPKKVLFPPISPLYDDVCENDNRYTLAFSLNPVIKIKIEIQSCRSAYCAHFYILLQAPVGCV